MWTLIKTEINYSKRTLILILTLTVFMLIFQSFQSDWNLLVVYLLLPYFAVVFTVLHTSKEKRELYYSLLPVPAVEVAFFRIIMIVFPFAVMSALYYGILAAVRVETEYGAAQLMTFMGIYLFGFSINLLRRDLKSKSSPSRSFRTFPVAKFGFLAVVILLLLGTFIMTKLSAGSGETTISGVLALFVEYIRQIFDILFTRIGVIVIYAVNASLFGLSIITYLRRKSFLNHNAHSAWY